MVAQVASLYPVKTLKDKAPVETLDSSSGGTKTSMFTFFLWDVTS